MWCLCEAAIVWRRLEIRMNGVRLQLLSGTSYTARAQPATPIAGVVVVVDVDSSEESPRACSAGGRRRPSPCILRYSCLVRCGERCHLLGDVRRAEHVERGAVEGGRLGVGEGAKGLAGGMGGIVGTVNE